MSKSQTMFKHRNLMPVCLAAVLALGLAACGGGGGGDAPMTSMMDGDVSEPTRPAELGVEVADLMYLDEDNAPMAGTMMVAAGEMATNNGVIFMCPAGGDDCEVTVNADGSATSTGGAATATLSADAILQVAQAKRDAQDEAERATLENRDRIIGKDLALEAAANIGTGGPVKSAIIISRAAGKMASVTSMGYSMSEDPVLPNGDWAGTRLMQPVTGVGTNHLFVYTDIEAPTRVQFYDFDADPDTPYLYGAASGTPLTPVTVVGLNLDGSVADAPLNAATLDLTKFPAPGPVEEGDIARNYPVNDDPGTTGTNSHVSIPGNYNGAGGNYTCAAATAEDGCSVIVTPGGAYTLGGGVWTFVPELNATAWRQDGEFMSFGWWLQEPTSATAPYTFEYYADGSPVYNPTGITVAAGLATYNGRAAGKYVVQEIDDTGVVDGMAGRFVAAASLTANFTATTGGGGTLSGTISGFEGEHAEVSGWSVTLNRQALIGNITLTSVTGTPSPTAPGFDGTTATMGDQTAYGTWTSQFFGQPTPATSNAYPPGVGGTFQADNEAASIAGAFGARR